MSWKPSPACAHDERLQHAVGLDAGGQRASSSVVEPLARLVRVRLIFADGEPRDRPVGRGHLGDGVAEQGVQPAAEAGLGRAIRRRSRL